MKLDEIDVKYACFRLGVSYDRLAKEARMSRLDREYKEIGAEVDRLIEEQASLVGKNQRTRYLACSDAIDALWKKQDANLAERFPDQVRATPKEPTT